jgi:Zn-dependent protease with chaperone function
MQPTTYPPSPQAINFSLLQPGKAFKQQVIYVVLSVVLFFMFYLVLLTLAGLLLVGCFYAGIGLIAALTSLFGILIGVGIMALGVLVFWFLIKFLFRVQRTDESGMLEVKEQDQPELFAFLRKLTTETQTPFPKKVLLSPEVNASVFYNSSFWSMFLPVRKNLVIGLGLVNALNLAELKAVMAHEFGHFSQRSMKLGSYVYQVNRVMYNMLFDNEGYGRVLQGFSSVHGAFGLIAQITVWIVTGIQKVLQWLYGFINKRYMSLSRQMEFHADTVAASVSGGNHLIQALRRIELADSAWNETVDQYNRWLDQSKKASNAFTHQRWMIQQIAQNNKLHNSADMLPFISDEVLNTVQKGRVNIENQ